MRRTLALAVISAALVTPACGGDDEETTAATTEPAPTTTEQTTTQALSNEALLRQTAEEWAPLFGRGSEQMCDYLHSEISAACSILTGPPTAFVTSFADAKVQSVEIEGSKQAGWDAVVQFSNGEAVEFRRELDDWQVVNLGGNAGAGGP